MSFSIEPAYTVSSELMRQLTRASTNIVNQWFFLEGTFSTLAKIIQTSDTWYYENFVVIADKHIIAYFEGEWARPLNIIHNFRMILLDKSFQISATKAFFNYLDYLFRIRGCDVFNWSVATENKHAFLLYEKFISKKVGRKIGTRTRCLKSYCGNISNSVLYEITKEEYFKYIEAK